MLYNSSTLNGIHSYYMQIFWCNDNKLLTCNIIKPVTIIIIIINTLPNDIGHYVSNGTDSCIYYGSQGPPSTTCF